jgi:hypothetical protein
MEKSANAELYPKLKELNESKMPRSIKIEDLSEETISIIYGNAPIMPSSTKIEDLSGSRVLFDDNELFVKDLGNYRNHKPIEFREDCLDYTVLPLAPEEGVWFETLRNEVTSRFEGQSSNLMLKPRTRAQEDIGAPYTPYNPFPVVCEACHESFTTKYSLKRHLERKPQCQRVKEANTETKPTEVPADIKEAKPLHVQVDEWLQKAISGDSTLPYCRHCDVEFANKGNLNKHITKSIPCNTLATAEFIKLVKS